jgi:glycosyltransferase involved in cell wall biosynthesis
LGEGKLWHRNVGSLKVFGAPLKDSYDFKMFLRFFRKYEFVIYSGYDDWGKKLHPNILISHGVNWDTQDKGFRIRNIRKIISDADTFISVDTNTISWLRTTFLNRLQNNKMYFIPNYVDTDIYKPIENKKNAGIRIAFPRRLSVERGYWLISAIAPRIMQRYPNAELKFIGFIHGEKIKSDIERLINSFPERIKHQLAEPDDMVNEYQQTDISLIPTLFSEGTSLSCLEAQACGNIVIATNIGGLPNLVIDGYNGLLINPNEEELLNAIDRVISNPAFAKQISKNAVSVAKAFDKKIWQARWEKIIAVS